MVNAQELPELIAASRRGDLEAFSEVVRQLHGQVRGQLAMMAVAPDWIDDVAQEAFIEAFRSLSAYDPARPFAGWLRGITRNVGLRHAERTASESKARQGATAELLRRQSERVFAGDAGTDLGLEKLRRCLDRLPSETRVLLDQRYVEERTSEEIARRRSCSAEAVRMLLMRARRSLLECVRLGTGGAS
jgi:RNA polymerase sigma-70 factor (ECF subfamily)